MAFSQLELGKVTVHATVAAGTGETWEMMKAPSWTRQGELIEGWWCNGATLTGHATIYTTIDVYNATQAVSMAARPIITPTTDDVAIDTPQALTPNVLAASKKYNASDRIQARKVDTSTGMAVTVPAAVFAWFALSGTYD